MQRLQSFKANLLACSKTVLAIERPIFLQFLKTGSVRHSYGSWLCGMNYLVMHGRSFTG